MVFKFCRNLILVYFFISFITVACETSTSPLFKDKQLDTLYSTTHFLWPSTVGSYWDYKSYESINHFNTDSNWAYENFSSFGVDLDTVQIEPSMYRLEIVDSIFINIRDTMYECHVFDGYDPVKEKYRNLKSPYWIGEDGLFSLGIYVEGKDTLFNKGLYIPSEIPLNVNWGGQFSYRIDGFLLQTSSVLERKCLSKTEILNTPMGEFECYVILTRIRQADDMAGYFYYYNYYTPSIGLLCTVRLSGAIGIMPDGATQWWLDFVSIINKYSVN